MSELIVPITVDALVINAGFPATGLREWWYDYEALSDFRSPEPAVAIDEDPDTQPQPGIRIRWTLPEALRHGRQDPQTGEVTYPPIPNRWLVLRQCGSQFDAIVLESDCPNPESPARHLVHHDVLSRWQASGDPHRAVEFAVDEEPRPVRIGKAFTAGEWSERAPEATFLTAVAPGNVLFSGYEPHHRNVLSWHDELVGFDDETFDYMVIGWFSNPAEDMFGPGIDADTRMTELGWRLSGDGHPDFTSTVYHGVVRNVPWHRYSTEPLTSHGPVEVGIGQTTMDAMAALLRERLGEHANTAFPDLLRAFQHGLLPVLSEVNGRELLDHATHQASFSSVPGGYRWRFQPRSEDPPPPSPGELAWLGQLNADQAELDAADTELRTARWTFYALWWMLGRGRADRPPSFEEDIILRAIESTAVGQIDPLARRVAELSARIPQPDRADDVTEQEALQRGINAFAATRNLSADYSLEAVPSPRYWRTEDPVVVLAGLAIPPRPAPDEVLLCRQSDELPEMSKWSSLPNLPMVCSQLAAELGSRSDDLVWQQPWSPLLLEWAADYLPLPDKWVFDGYDYRYVDGLPAAPAPVRVGGLSLLNDEAQFTFHARLAETLDAFSDAPGVATLREWLPTISHWPFASQALVGLNDVLARRDRRAQRVPMDRQVLDRVGDELDGVPLVSDEDRGFHPVRQGLLILRRVRVVDVSGQVLEVPVGEGVAVDPALAPDEPLVAVGQIQLRPRVARHARLDFLFADGDAPIAGWVLPNHLDQGLSVYAKDGKALGSIRELADLDGTKRPVWEPPPHRPVRLTDIPSPLADMVAAITQSSANFHAMLDVIDRTLWTVDPPAEGTLSLLIGRPLALVPATLALRLDGGPPLDLSKWTWPPSRPSFMDQEFAVRLGARATRQDGLIGYFAGNDFSTFHSVAELDADYLRPIGPIGDLTDPNYLSLRFDGPAAEIVMLLDPQSAVHAITGVLPLKTLEIPYEHIAHALSELEVSFPVGSLLTQVRQSADGPVVTAPRPGGDHGEWTWWEKNVENTAAAFGITVDGGDSDLAVTVRDGHLQLIVDLDPGEEP